MKRVAVEDDVPERARQASIQVMLQHFRNIPAGSTDVPSMTLKSTCDGIDDALQLAERAYADVQVDNRGIGGRSLLIGFFLERNRSLRGRREVVFPNASALGLQYSCTPGGLVDHLLSGRLILTRAVGGPPLKREDNK